ncbi:hybrid sensor histidine kinase/response regulator [Microvirga arsenatis]|nr:PAS domain S-box protein [Microvirga arsenatis]
MGRLTRSHDWSRTSLGPISAWPQSLKTTVGILLRSPVPIVLLWGPDGVMIYNDAYSSFAGGRHPLLFGSKVREGWPEVADFNDHVMKVGLSGGTLSYRDQELTLYRNGAPEQVWMNLDYSPVLDESGRPAGVLAVVVETTERVLAQRALARTEERLSYALNAAGMVGTFDWHIQADTFYSDARFAAMFSVDPDKGETGAPIGEYFAGIHPEDRERISDAVNHAIATGERYTQEYRLLQKDGTVRWIEARGECLYDEEGKPVRFPGVAVDITERRRTEATLRESEERFRNVADNSPVMVWVTGPDGSCTFLSRSWYEFTGQTPETALGFGWLDATHPDDKAEAERIFLAANAKRESFRLEYRLRRADGSYAWAIDAAAPRFGEDGEFLGYVGSVVDIDERKRLEVQLAETSRRLDAILNNTQMAVFMMDHRQHCVYMNKAAEDLTGYTLAEVQGRPLHDVVHHTRPDGTPYPLCECPIDRALPKNNQEQGEEIFVHKDGRFYPVAFTASPIRDEAGRPIGTVIEARNIEQELRARAAMEAFNATLEQRVTEAIAEREKVEALLRQSQKMEALGQLTGGVAHDFNNLLQVISGNLQLLAKDIAGNVRAETRVQNALAGVSRGSKLASQLLAFGRRQPLEPKVVNIGRFIKGMDDMLRRTLGEEIEVETVVSGGLWNAQVDPGQIENAILNLAINARDAMNGQGRLTIEAGNALLDDRYALQHDVAAGQYVMLAITDTGCGIPPEILDRVFDPFFSTKPEGKGTGLGLSMVYGFVKQSGGHIKIYSEVGQGTTVRIYLPRVYEQEDVLTDLRTAPVRGGSETILVVEDDEDVRETAVALLSDLGYRVLKARDATSALSIIESGLEIDLLFTDVVMPGPLRSPELARKARARLPHIAVLFTSGYTENAIVHGGRLDPGVELLAKPYLREDLARKIRHVLANQQQRNRVALSAPDAAPPAARVASTKSWTVLLVEDDELIRSSTAEMLTELGHRVVQAVDATSALKALEADAVDILVADVGLPDLSGAELAKRALEQRPGLGIIFATGDETVSAEDSLKRAVLLVKPYAEQELAQALSKAASPSRLDAAE